MANKDAHAQKEPGRIKQMWQVFQMTRRHDSNAVWVMLVAWVIPVAIATLLAFLLTPDNGFTIALWIIAGVVGGLLSALIVLGRRAERAAYSQIEGKPGAVGAVLRSSLRRGWSGSEMPIAVNGKTHDAVYRAVGRGGVALIGEGSKARLTRMIEEERRKINRMLPNVPVTLLFVGTDSGAVSLAKLPKSLRTIKSKLNRAEVLAINNRLSALNTQPPVPKGVDPLKARPQRAR